MKLKKLLIYIMLFISLFNFIYPTIVRADESDDEIAEYFNEAGLGGALLDGLIGILTYVQRLEVLLVGTALSSITAAVANGEGTVSGATLTDEEHLFITPGTILFNKINLTDINIFDTSTSGAAINRIRASIRDWYWVTFTLSAIILVLVLIYIGIRMAISTVAEKKAIYQKMLTNWFVSMVILFMLHFIIRATLFLNTQLVKIFADAAGTAVGTGNMYMSLQAKALLPAATVSWASVLVFFCLVILTLMFLFIYIKRMLTICFLVVIAPLITVTYSIDKIGDNKSQALDTWLKEFMFGVLIQPFHCLVYLVFVSTAIDLTTAGTFSSIVLAIMMMFFIMKAEGIVRKIFGFEKSSSLSGAIGAAASVGVGMTAAKSLLKDPSKNAKGGAGAASGSGGAGGSGGSGTQNLTGQRGTKVNSMPGAGALNVKSGKAATAINSAKSKISGAINSTKGKIGGAIGKTKVGQGVNRFFSNTKVGKLASNVASKAGKSGANFLKDRLNPVKTLRRPSTHMASFGIMGGLTAGMMGQSVATGALGGMAIGKSVGGYVEKGYTAAEDHKDDRMLATAYNNLKDSLGYNDDQMQALTNDYLNNQDGLNDMQRLQGESEQDWFNRTATNEEKLKLNDGEHGMDAWRDRMNYSQALYSTQKKYEGRGSSTQESADKIMDTIKQVGDGKIKGYKAEANYNAEKKAQDLAHGYEQQQDSMWE